MKYYLIAGEASGDLHASHLMRALKELDDNAEFRFFGGDMMAAEGGTLVRHYRDLAYMGFIQVALHLRTILKGMKQCQQDILTWQPDVLILVDYPGFNLKIARFIKNHFARINRENDGARIERDGSAKPIPVYYYISPKIWAWKEHRINAIRRDVDELFSILPFEVDFFEKKHNYPIHYVGNPTVDEVDAYLRGEAGASSGSGYSSGSRDSSVSSSSGKPIIALLAGSRKQEVKDNLRRMIEAARPFADRYELVLAGAPGLTPDDYRPYLNDVPVTILYGRTYDILHSATAALVTSGTATLETALFRVPQVVCYYIRCGRLVSAIRPYFLKVKYISLVNLIADSEVVPELVADGMTVENCRRHLESILPGGSARQAQLDGYEEMARRLGEPGAPRRAAKLMIEKVKTPHPPKGGE